MRRLLSILAVSAFLSRAGAQTQPAFEVASLKPSPPSPGDAIDINLGIASNGVVTLRNTTLSECLRFAYGLTNEDQIAGPEWIRNRDLRVDILAKAPPVTPKPELLLMLQRLLTDRFALALHHEPRRIPHFQLTLAKNGPRLTLSESAGPSVRKTYATGNLVYTSLPLDTLAALLSRQLRQPVLNSTGLAGAYDIALEWTPDAADPSGPPDLFTAIQQQLGLKLSPANTPLDVLVIDRAEKVPLPN